MDLLDDARLHPQLVALERRRRAGRRDVVNHPPGQHDDRANSAVGALLPAAVVNDAEMLGNFLPYRPPVRLSDRTLRRVLGRW